MINFLIVKEIELPKNIDIYDEEKMMNFINEFTKSLLRNFIKEINCNDDKFFVHNIGKEKIDLGEVFNQFILLANFRENRVYKFVCSNRWYSVNNLEESIIFEIDIVFYANTFYNEIDTYLELLKISVKDCFLKILDSCKCIWIRDDQSVQLSEKCYRELNEIENELRAFINKVMINEFGWKWTEMIKEKNVINTYQKRTLTYKDHFPSFSDVDDFLFSLDIKQLQIFFNDENENSKNNNENINFRQIFKNYLSNSFNLKWTKISDKRNHIAHNKLIDLKFLYDVKSLCNEIRNIINIAEDEFDIMKKKDIRNIEISKLLYEEIDSPINKCERFKLILNQLQQLYRITKGYEANPNIKINNFLDKVDMELEYNTILIIEKQLDIYEDLLGLGYIPKLYKEVLKVQMHLDNTFTKGIRPKIKLELIVENQMESECILAHNGYKLLSNIPDIVDQFIAIDDAQNSDFFGVGWDDFVNCFTKNINLIVS